MPRLRVVSDLHVEISPFHALPDQDFDILVCAGDVVEGDPAEGARLLSRLAMGKPVVWTLGNHDLWGVAVEDAVVEARGAGSPLGVHLLHDSDVTIDGVTFLGSTLWTDGFLNQPLIGPGDPSGLPVGTRRSVHGRAGPFGEPIFVRGPDMDRRAKCVDIFRMHERSLDWLSLRLQDGHARGERMVAVTHHAPTPLSLAESWRMTPHAVMSASDLGLVENGQAEMWIHGHIHASVDLAGPTRLLNNPRGGHARNPDFDPGMTVFVRGASNDAGPRMNP